MKKLFVLAIACMFTASAYAAEMKWNGSIGTRYNKMTQNDGLNSFDTTVPFSGSGVAVNADKSTTNTKTLGFRANLGVTGGWDKVEFGIGGRTLGQANGSQSDWVNFNNNIDRFFGWELAWFRYNADFGFGDLALTFGRQKAAFAYDMQSQNMFDNDLRWDGLGWNWKWGSFGFNMVQYVITASDPQASVAAAPSTTNGSQIQTNGATDVVAATRGHFAMLYGFQPTMNWRFSDDIDTFLAVGLFNYSGTDNLFNNQLHGFVAPSTGTASTLNVDNSQLYQVLNTWTLPYSLAANIEVVWNKEVKYLQNTSVPRTQRGVNTADNTAWTAGLTYGKLKRAHDFMIGYAYGVKGLAAVMGSQTYDRFAPDMKGHTIDVKYNVDTNFNLAWKGVFTKEKSRKDLSGAGIATSEDHSQNYWELVAGVNF